MKKNALFLMVIILLSACQKKKAQLKRIDGTWQVELVRVLDGEGFTFYDSLPSGIISISSDELKMNGRIDFNYSHFGINQVQDSFVVDQAYFTINEKGDHLSLIRSTDTIDVRLLSTSKKNLEFEYYDYHQYRLRRFVLRKL
ncbi:MAG: hypothetical protein ACKOXP_01460 [Flavobacteriales bacterium]